MCRAAASVRELSSPVGAVALCCMVWGCAGDEFAPATQAEAGVEVDGSVQDVQPDNDTSIDSPWSDDETPEAVQESSDRDDLVVESTAEEAPAGDVACAGIDLFATDLAYITVPPSSCDGGTNTPCPSDPWIGNVGNRDHVLLRFNLPAEQANVLSQSPQLANTTLLLTRTCGTGCGPLAAQYEVHAVIGDWSPGTCQNSTVVGGATWCTRDGTLAWGLPGASQPDVDIDSEQAGQLPQNAQSAVQAPLLSPVLGRRMSGDGHLSLRIAGNAVLYSIPIELSGAGVPRLRIECLAEP